MARRMQRHEAICLHGEHELTRNLATASAAGGLVKGPLKRPLGLDRDPFQGPAGRRYVKLWLWILPQCMSLKLRLLKGLCLRAQGWEIFIPNLSLTWGSCGFVSDVAEGGPRMQTVLGIILASQSDDRGKARAPGVASDRMLVPQNP